MRKGNKKKLLLISIGAVFLVTALLKLNIEPADYRKSISKEINKANLLISEAVIGNENGQYSNNAMEAIKLSIENAENLLKDEESPVSKEKEVYIKLKKAIDIFKEGKNKNCLSKEEIEGIKTSKEDLTKEVQLKDGTKVLWEISGKAIGEPAAINLEVSNDTVNEKKIQALAKIDKASLQILSFRHNDELPGFMSLTIKNTYDFKEGYIYYYDSAKESLKFISKATISDNNLLFSIDRGGDWIITASKLEEIEANNLKEPLKAKEDTEKKDKGNEVKDNKEENDDTKLEVSSSGVSSAGKSENKGNGGSLTENSKPNNKVEETPNAGKEDEVVPPSDKKYCTIEIRCDTILNNMDKLTPGLEKYVPKNGVILSTIQVEIYDGENVFDILKRVTRDNRIQMEFRNDPVYSGAYIEGINYLYEFDCGNESGWMYKVNGWFPNYGCSQYKVQNGDSIVWIYTCDLGRDVGDQYYD